MLHRKLALELQAMQHANGRPLCVLYSGLGLSFPLSYRKDNAPAQSGVVGQGPVVTFNLLRPDGSFVGYRYLNST